MNCWRTRGECILVCCVLVDFKFKLLIRFSNLYQMNGRVESVKARPFNKNVYIVCLELSYVRSLLLAFKLKTKWLNDYVFRIKYGSVAAAAAALTVTVAMLRIQLWPLWLSKTQFAHAPEWNARDLFLSDQFVLLNEKRTENHWVCLAADRFNCDKKNGIETIH